MAFTGLTWAGIRSDNGLQPYNVFSARRFYVYRAVIKAYPPGFFIKDSFHKAFTGVRENPEDELLKDQWLAIVKHKAVFDLLFSSALAAFFLGSVLTILFRKDITWEAVKPPWCSQKQDWMERANSRRS